MDLVLLLTEDNDDRLDEVDHSFLVAWVKCSMLRHPSHLPLDVDENVSIDNHHNEEDKEIGKCPEGQISATVERSHRRAIIQLTQAVPAI